MVHFYQIVYLELNKKVKLGKKTPQKDSFTFYNNRELKQQRESSENITKKINLCPFKLYRVYLELLNSSYVGDFSWS